MGSGSSTASIEFSVRGSHESRSMSTQPEGNFETVLISSDWELDTMASKEGESSSGSSTASIEFPVCDSHGYRSISTQTEGDFETVFISSDSEPSGNSETTNRTKSTQDPLGVNVSPLMFESQSTEKSNVGTQSEDTNICRQIFPTESVTQNYSDTSSGIIPENADESTENADESTETAIFETSDSNTNTDLVSSAESEPSDNTTNTQSLSQYVRGPETLDNSQEMYPDTLSQSSEVLIRSDRRCEQRYEFASEDCSNSLDPNYEPPAFEIPKLTREDAITPSTSSKHDLESTEEDNDENKTPKKKKK